MHDPVPHRPDALDQPLRGRAAPRPDHAQLATQPRWPLRAARPRQVALPPLGAEPPPDALRHRGALSAQVTPTRPHRTPQPTQARHRSVRWEGQLSGIAASRRPSTVGRGGLDRPTVVRTPPPPSTFKVAFKFAAPMKVRFFLFYCERERVKLTSATPARAAGAAPSCARGARRGAPPRPRARPTLCSTYK